MTKKMISIVLENVEIDGDVDQAIKMLQKYKDRYSKDHTLLYLSGGMTSYPYDSAEYYVLHLKGTRLENDAEYEKRTAEEAVQAARREQREKEQYEALKKKFS